MARVLYLGAPGLVNHKRFFDHKSGMSVEDIAKRDEVSPETVKRSIQVVDSWRNSHTTEEVNQALAEILIGNKAKAGEQICRALDASMVIQDGEKVVTVPDYVTQNKAMENFIRMAETLQPKGAKISVSASASAGAAARTTETTYMGFEERLRQIRSQMANPAAPVTVIEAGDVASLSPEESVTE